MLPIGTKVWDIILQQEGEVVPLSVSECLFEWPVKLQFKNSYGYYNSDGRGFTSDKLPRLSLTPFNYITGEGVFTPIDREPPIQEGEIVYAWDKEGGTVIYGKVKQLKPNDHYNFTISNNNWIHASRTPPEWVK